MNRAENDLLNAAQAQIRENEEAAEAWHIVAEVCAALVVVVIILAACYGVLGMGVG